LRENKELTRVKGISKGIRKPLNKGVKGLFVVGWCLVLRLGEISGGFLK